MCADKHSRLRISSIASQAAKGVRPPSPIRFLSLMTSASLISDISVILSVLGIKRKLGAPGQFEDIEESST